MSRESNVDRREVRPQAAIGQLAWAPRSIPGGAPPDSTAVVFRVLPLRRGKGV